MTRYEKAVLIRDLVREHLEAKKGEIFQQECKDMDTKDWSRSKDMHTQYNELRSALSWVFDEFVEAAKEKDLLALENGEFY